MQTFIKTPFLSLITFTIAMASITERKLEC